jgi:hypothetical protein
MRPFKTFALIAALGLALGSPLPAGATSAPAQQSAKPARTYSEVLLDEKHTDAKAADIATQVLKDDMALIFKMGPSIAPAMYARFIALGDGQPKTSIAARFEHPAFCGSAGCRIVILTPGKKGYRITFDQTAMGFYLNQRPGQPMYDVLVASSVMAPRSFGVYFWNAKQQQYQYAGLSWFSTP